MPPYGAPAATGCPTTCACTTCACTTCGLFVSAMARTAGQGEKWQLSGEAWAWRRHCSHFQLGAQVLAASESFQAPLRGDPESHAKSQITHTKHASRLASTPGGKSRQSIADASELRLLYNMEAIPDKLGHCVACYPKAPKQDQRDDPKNKLLVRRDLCNLYARPP